MRYFYHPDLTPEMKRFGLEGPDAHHIRRVLRLPVGETIRLLDGRGRVYEAAIEGFSKTGVRLKLLGHFESEAESDTHIHIGQGYLKDKKMDALVRPLSELGIRRWFPVFTRYSVARPAADRLADRQQRWQKIAAESLKQCRRGRLLQVGQAVEFEHVFDKAADFNIKLIFWEQATEKLESLNQRIIRPGDRVLALLGPEGGFDAAEVERAAKAGFTVVSLGPRILKAETATVAAATVLQFVFGDMGKK
jgi:16S rRNA (uracil1498-N3)-methyltransferase